MNPKYLNYLRNFLMLIMVISITTVSGYNSQKIETKKDTVIVNVNNTMSTQAKIIELNGMEFRVESFSMPIHMQKPIPNTNSSYTFIDDLLNEKEYLYGDFKLLYNHNVNYSINDLEKTLLVSL